MIFNVVSDIARFLGYQKKKKKNLKNLLSRFATKKKFKKKFNFFLKK